MGCSPSWGGCTPPRTKCHSTFWMCYHVPLMECTGNIVPTVFFFNFGQKYFCRGGEIRKPHKSVLLKTGHKNSSIEDKKASFLLKCVKFNYNLFKRNQTLSSIIELFLWPIFSKTDLWGFRIPPLLTIFFVRK